MAGKYPRLVYLRQIIWGHQIPAWYDDDGKVYVARNEDEARAQSGGLALRRESDVLDTWFFIGAVAFFHFGLAQNR